MIIGEGPTEYYYFNSLKDRFRDLQIEPTIPKHTHMKELGRKIEECIAAGYAKIFCVIDMDNKGVPSESSLYQRLKEKYSKPVSKTRNGIHCEVKFFETHRCTELFFLFYFIYTAKAYDDQESLIKDLNAFCLYEKRIEFFRKCKGLHAYFEKHGGSLDAAIVHAQHSCEEAMRNNRDYTYSQLGAMLKELLDK